MEAPAIIPEEMAQPPIDSFATCLMRLRKSRDVSARLLSLKLGKNESFIHQWEHRPKRITRKPLHQVTVILKLSDSERRELFALADQREAPGDAKHIYEARVDPDQNVLDVLLEGHHDWPAEPPNPNAQSARAKLLVEAASWIMAKVAVTSPKYDGMFHTFRAIRWPEPLVQCGIVPSAKPFRDAIDIPKYLIKEELPFVDLLKPPVTTQDLVTQTIGVARVFRRLLFSDIERARAVARELQVWQYDLDQRLPEALSLRFSSTDLNEKLGVTNVGCRTVAYVGERSLACTLFVDAQTQRKDDDMFRRWRCRLDPADWTTLSMVEWIGPRHTESYEAAQELRDSVFRMRSVTWPFVCQTIAERHGLQVAPGAEPEIASQLSSKGELDEATSDLVRREPWRLAVIDQNILRAALMRHLAIVPGLRMVLDPSRFGGAKRTTKRTTKPTAKSRPRSKKKRK